MYFFRNFFICRKKVCNKELKIEETKEWRYKKGRKEGRGEGKKEKYFLHLPNLLLFHSSFIPTTSSYSVCTALFSCCKRFGFSVVINMTHSLSLWWAESCFLDPSLLSPLAGYLCWESLQHHVQIENHTRPSASARTSSSWSSWVCEVLCTC